MRICGFPLGMSLEDVVHHCQAETAHQFTMEQKVTVVHAVTQPMEVIKQMSCLFIRQFDDGVLVQRDTATDAVVVRWQQSAANHSTCKSVCPARFLTLSGIGITTKSFLIMW